MFGRMPMPKMPKPPGRETVATVTEVAVAPAAGDSSELLDRIGFTDSTMRCESCEHHNYAEERCEKYGIPCAFDDGCREGYEPMSGESGEASEAAPAVNVEEPDEVVS